MNNVIRSSLDGILIKYEDLSQKLECMSYDKDIDLIKKTKILLSQYSEIVQTYKNYLKIEKNILENKKSIETLKNKELISLLNEENSEQANQLIIFEENLKILLVPKDKRDKKNVIIEIRGAAGGNEANIFVGDMFKMYSKYAEYNHWTIELINSIESSAGGFTQIEFYLKGKNVFSKMKYESGVHRVQRIPLTESRGRVHTSTISVAVLAEADDIDIDINSKDLRIDTYRASGAGGQHVNKTDSAVRLTHIPTGIVVASQDGRSQHSNKDKAMKILSSKLYEKKYQEEQNKMKKSRNIAIGTGSRSEKIRTYNYPQNRITDHRINLSLNKLDVIINSGSGLEEILNPLNTYYQDKAIENFT